MTAEQALDVLEGIIGNVIEPRAAEVDTTGTFPRASIDALGKAGLLGLISSPDVGGMGLGPSTASAVIERIAKACGSTAMVVTMHFSATAAIEAHGDNDVVVDVVARCGCLRPEGRDDLGRSPRLVRRSWFPLAR